MRNWSLRSRLTLLLSLVLLVFVLLSGAAYWAGSREENRLEETFREEHQLALAMPAQRTLIRQIDIYAGDFLLTLKQDWLKRRRNAIAEFKTEHAKFSASLSDPTEIEGWRQVGEAFDRYIAVQENALRRARSGTMTRAETVELALAKDEVDSLMERLSRFGRIGLDRLDVQRRAARSATLATLGFVLFIGVLGALALSAAVSRIILSPILRLGIQASQWHLGEPWPDEQGNMPAEIRELLKTMRRMAGSLNAQFERERDGSRLKTQLISAVSHEFNNALTVMHTAHVLLQENDKSPDDTVWHGMLEANIRALSAMATNLLHLGRLEAGHFRIESQRVDLSPLLRSTLERLAVIGKRKNQNVSLDLPRDLPTTSGDPDALPLVVANLLTNAFKYTPEGGSVALRACALPNDTVEVSVTDTGIGVAPEDREKIFSGYYRTEQGKKTAKGFGVGLALSRMILEAHGSELLLESSPGEGSRFYFVLPIFKPA